MDKSQVTEYRERDGNAELKFADGYNLLLVPYRILGNIEGFDSVLLYKEGVLEALATNASSRYLEEGGGFWSRGQISQHQLAEYWEVARDVGDGLYDDYRANRIDKKTWVQKLGFWMVTLKGGITKESLKKGEERILEKYPARLRCWLSFTNLKF